MSLDEDDQEVGTSHPDEGEDDDVISCDDLESTRKRSKAALDVEELKIISKMIVL